MRVHAHMHACVPVCAVAKAVTQSSQASRRPVAQVELRDTVLAGTAPGGQPEYRVQHCSAAGQPGQGFRRGQAPPAAFVPAFLGCG